MRRLVTWSIVLVGCAPDPTPAREAGVPLRVGVPFAITRPSPFTDDGLGALIQELVFGSVLREDRPGVPAGAFGHSWAWSADGTRLTIKLESEARFSDGATLTARDVEDTYRHAMELGGWGMKELRRIRAVDDSTVEVEPANPFVLPEGLATGVARRGTEPPIGAGRYRVQSLDAEHLVLELNPHYHSEPGRADPRALADPPGAADSRGPDAAPRPPDRIEFHHLESTGETWSQLFSQQVDLVTYVPWNKYEIYRAIPSVRRVSSLSRALTLIAFHHPDPPFDRADVRRALSLAIDRPELVQGAMHGHGRPAAGVVWPESVDCDPSVLPDPYDAAAALRLFAAAGITPGSDGKLVWKGAPLRLKLLFWKGNVEHEDLALHLERQLAEIGLGVELTGVPSTEYAALSTSPRHTVVLQLSHAANDLLAETDASLSPGPAPATVQARRAAVFALQRRLHDEPTSIYLYWMERLAVIDRSWCGLPRLPDGPESALQLVHRCAPGEDE